MNFPWNRRLPLYRCAARTIGFWTIASFPTWADVRVHPLFSDHTVLQRSKSIPVWGTAAEGESITVEFGGQKASTTSHNGRWMVRLTPMNADIEGRELKITGPSNRVVLQDVVVGEVWVCSGQSNMEWPLSRSFQSTNDIANSANGQLRLFQVTKRRSNDVKLDLDYAPQKWVLAGPETVPSFSAVGYYFGRDLERSMRSAKVPVGVIHSSWGGSPAEVWMSEAVLKGDPEYLKEIWTPGIENYEKWQASVTQWETDAAAAKGRGESPKGNRPGQPWRPSELYNGMLANLMPYAIQGAI